MHLLQRHAAFLDYLPTYPESSFFSTQLCKNFWLIFSQAGHQIISCKCISTKNK